MEIERLVVGIVTANCYLVRCSPDGEAVVIDPGAEGKKILAAADEKGLKLRYIINTHGHGDHIGGNRYIKEQTGAEILIHSADAHMLLSARDNLSTWIPGGITSPPADRLLADGDTITCADTTFTVFSTPGHTPGSISLSVADVVFTGDTLFKRSIGRTDFPGGSLTDILASIRGKLLTLPAQTVVYPGHGPATTIGQEKQSNPFLE
ncbi:MAG: MBL fold metallo-hydrolase [Firmicutes bacterium]|nr:MBL fold metallo-hydrolase [Bacillota bacterium]